MNVSAALSALGGSVRRSSRPAAAPPPGESVASLSGLSDMSPRSSLSSATLVSAMRGSGGGSASRPVRLDAVDEAAKIRLSLPDLRIVSYSGRDIPFEDRVNFRLVSETESGTSVLQNDTAALVWRLFRLDPNVGSDGECVSLTS